MAGFLKLKRQAREWADQKGYTNGDFDTLYQSALEQSRKSGLRGGKARRDALFNAMQTAKNRDWIYEDQSTGEQAAYDELKKKYNLEQAPTEPRENDQAMDDALNAHGISQPAYINIRDRIQARQTEQAQTPTGESVKVTSTATSTPGTQPDQQQLSSNPVEAFYQKLNQHRADAGLAQKDYSGNYTPQTQPATVGTPQATDVTIETPAPGQPAQIQSAQEEVPAAPVQEKYKGQKDYDNLKFGQAFNQAMKDIGEGGTFYYKGKPIKLAYGKEEDATKQILQNVKGAYDPTITPGQQMKKYKDALNPGTETSEYYERPSGIRFK